MTPIAASAPPSDFKAMLQDAKDSGATPISYISLSSEKGGVAYSIPAYAIGTPKIDSDGSHEILLVASTDDRIETENSLRGSLTDEKWDSTGSVEFVMTVTWTTSGEYIKITNGSGYMVFHQSGLQVSNQVVRIGQSSPYTGVNESITRYPTATSHNYNTGFSRYVPKGPGGYYGTSWSGRITRGSTWNYSVYLNNFLN